ncbi:MAG: CHAT domain-containing protein [Cyanobacteria bacterium J06632_22]
MLLSPLMLAAFGVPVRAQITPANDQTQVTVQNGEFLIQGGITSSQGDNLFYGFEQFSLLSGESAVFHAADRVQNIFGQISGGQAAYINGRLAIAGAPANLYLINPSGILFGPDAQLSLPAHFTATTASQLGFANGWLNPGTDPTYLNGPPQQFSFNDPATSVINLADLAVSEGQSITLLGGTVINRGSLTAPSGAITILAVEQGMVQISQTGQILSLTGAAPEADWRLAAADLPEWLTGSDIDHALNLTQDASGQMLITGSELTLGPGPGSALIAGVIDTGSTLSGGDIQVLGQQVALIDASLQANSPRGGGTIHIGGSLQGQGPLPNAAITLVNEQTRLTANAIQQGDGGRIIVWANELTHFTGTASALGGALGGDGGFIEISGQEQLQFNGQIFLEAPLGSPGTLLLDPRNIVIRNGSGVGTDDSQLPSVLTNPIFPSFIIYEAVLEGLASADIILQAADSITIEPLGNLNFTASATGKITFAADTDGDGIGTFSMLATDEIDTGGRDLLITAASISTGVLTTGHSVAGNNAADAGDITLIAQNGSVTTGDLYANSEAGNNNSGLGGQVTIMATQDITTGDIFSNSLAGNNNATNAGDIALTTTSGNIITGSVNAFSQAIRNNAGNGGDIFLSAPEGQIETQEVQAFSRALLNNDGEAAGNVTLLADRDITVDYINAEGETNGGVVDIATDQQFSASDTFLALNGALASISSAGRTGDGNITLQTENTPFVIGGTPNNGTAGAVVAGLTNALLPAQTLTENVNQGNIQINLGTSPAASESPIMGAEGLAGNVAAQATVTQNTSTDLADINTTIVNNRQTDAVRQLAALENGFSEQFAEQLGLTGNYDVPLAFSLAQMQRVLKTAETQLDIRPALVYLYFADNQLEALVVTSQGQPIHRTTGLSQEQVLQLGHSFRRAVTNPTLLPADYLPPAQALYQALIAPIETELQQQDINNLALVLDSGLRSLPLAALHDGNQFLIERYALGILPTFNLTNFDWANTLHQRRDEPAVLAMGIAEFTDQPKLPAVPAELNVITQTPQDRAYLNAESTLDQLHNSLAGGSFGIVHLATHALFEPGVVEQAYVQLWDQSIQFDQLKSLDFQTANVSLLVLSACKTALGDEAAEFGFAGLAVSTGAQSALASLWAVSDDGALGFMSQFYQHLRSRPVRGEAVQQAQIALLRGQVSLDQGVLYSADGTVIATLPDLVGSGRWDFSHPVYWSAFTLIGNPW